LKVDLNELIPGAKYFYWHEMLWLPALKLHAFPTVQQYKNLCRTVEKLELIRDIFKAPLIITSGLRPGAYNAYIGGAPFSAHRDGSAADFQINGFRTQSTCNEAREILRPHLSELGIRLEKLSMADWLHIDLKPPGVTGRFFKP